VERVSGKQTLVIDESELFVLAHRYQTVSIDLGTGDGRWALEAATCPTHLGIGVDPCRENLRAGSREAPDNALFIIANALSLPARLADLAGSITINFPWGSLLAVLLTGDPALLRGLGRVSVPGASLEIRLNGGALAEHGWDQDTGTEQIGLMLYQAGFTLARVETLAATDLRRLPSTWARRLAHGRDPRGSYISTAIPTHIAVGGRRSA
jgi:hypothetical protein